MAFLFKEDGILSRFLLRHVRGRYHVRLACEDFQRGGVSDITTAASRRPWA